MSFKVIALGGMPPSNSYGGIVVRILHHVHQVHDVCVS